jgi:hypothetical protein
MKKLLLAALAAPLIAHSQTSPTAGVKAEQ